MQKNKGLKLGVAALSALTLTFAGALPALADDAPLIETTTSVKNVTGLPQIVGENYTFTVAIETGILTHLIPTGTVSVSAEGIDLGEFTLGDDAQTVVTLRPLQAGIHNLDIGYSGDENFASSETAHSTVEFSPAASVTELWIDSDPDAQIPTVFYGGQAMTYIEVYSDCEASAETEAEFTHCAETYGVPSGTVHLKMVGANGEVVAEGTSEIVGSANANEWGVPGESLMPAEYGSLAIITLEVPDALLGTPDSWDFQATFIPDNWFAGSTSGPRSVLAAPAPVFIDLLVDENENTGGPIQMMALVGTENFFAAEIQGTISFFDGDTPIATNLPITEDSGALFDWVPTASGAHAFRAEFVPSSGNHLGAVSETVVVQVNLPEPKPVEPEKQDAESSTPKKEELANTGANGLAGMGLTAFA
ncbi:MAG TPA: Ig-like domain-containing protein, partial [Microbacteriaceae bacterium]|nr:Ig-like domain-containing protein [Microbacteriaceae bacterium]